MIAQKSQNCQEVHGHVNMSAECSCRWVSVHHMQNCHQLVSSCINEPRLLLTRKLENFSLDNQQGKYLVTGGGYSGVFFTAKGFLSGPNGSLERFVWRHKADSFNYLQCWFGANSWRTWFVATPVCWRQSNLWILPGSCNVIHLVLYRQTSLVTLLTGYDLIGFSWMLIKRNWCSVLHIQSLLIATFQFFRSENLSHAVLLPFVSYAIFAAMSQMTVSVD